MITKIKRWAKYLDLHDERAIKRSIPVIFGLLIVFSIVVRLSLIKFQTGDYVLISQWYNFLHVHGLHGFKYNFATYDFPFLFALYIATKLPLSEIVAIKGLLIVFDVVLAASAYYIVRVFRPRNHLPLIAALVTMYVPTVLLTGVFGSQFDQLYTALVLFSLYFGLKDKSRLSWLTFGLAFAVKPQAAFFLPVLIIMCFKRINWYDIYWGVIAFAVVSFPPVLVGRPFMSILTLYSQQTEQFNNYLSANAPNIYQLFSLSPESRFFPYFDGMGLALALVFSLFVLLICLIYRRFSNKDLLLATALLLYGVPFLLPAMHERYFFPAGIATLVLAFVYSKIIYVVIAVIAQVVTIFTYCPFLFQSMPVQFPILSMATLGVIVALMAQFLRHPQTSEA